MSAERSTPREPDDPTEGLPDDLARVLRDQSIIVPQDQAVWELLAKWQNAPSNTASSAYPAVDEVWHVIERSRLMELLRRAHAGEDPDLLYIEEYVNAEREDVEPEEDV